MHLGPRNCGGAIKARSISVEVGKRRQPPTAVCTTQFPPRFNCDKDADWIEGKNRDDKYFPSNYPQRRHRLLTIVGIFSRTHANFWFRLSWNPKSFDVSVGFRLLKLSWLAHFLKAQRSRAKMCRLMVSLGSRINPQIPPPRHCDVTEELLLTNHLYSNLHPDT